MKEVLSTLSRYVKNYLPLQSPSWTTLSKEIQLLATSFFIKLSTTSLELEYNSQLELSYARAFPNILQHTRQLFESIRLDQIYKNLMGAFHEFSKVNLIRPEINGFEEKLNNYNIGNALIQLQ